jgi:hypothetical protein
MEALPERAADVQALVAERAYFMAEQRGFAPGYVLEDWLAAERELAAPAAAKPIRSRPVLTEVGATKAKKKAVARKKTSAAAVKKVD